MNGNELMRICIGIPTDFTFTMHEQFARVPPPPFHRSHVQCTRFRAHWKHELDTLKRKIKLKLLCSILYPNTDDGIEFACGAVLFADSQSLPISIMPYYFAIIIILFVHSICPPQQICHSNEIWNWQLDIESIRIVWKHKLHFNELEFSF